MQSFFGLETVQHFVKIHEEQGEHYVVLKKLTETNCIGVMINGTNWVSCMYLELISFSLSFCPVLWVMRTKKCSLHELPCPLTTTLIFKKNCCMFKYSSPTFHECNVTTADDTLWERRSWDRHDSKVTNFLPNLRAQDGGGNRNRNFIFPSF